MKDINKSSSTAGQIAPSKPSKSTSNFSDHRVALVYDRVNKWGGAERVLLTLQQIFPLAPVYTLVYQPAAASWASVFTVIPSFFNKLPFLRSRHELLAPVAAIGFESFNFDNFDLVISVTSADAKAIITKPGTIHLCYCLTPTRYLWSGIDQYSMAASVRRITDWFQRFDYVAAQRPDHYLAISREVQRRIKQYYHRDSQIIYPPIDYGFWSGIRNQKLVISNYYLVVSRLVPYKKVDLVVQAFSQPHLQGVTLKVVGTGSQLEHLKSIATNNVQFLGSVDDLILRELYANAKAVIFPQHEDFGLVPLEAQAAGTPVIAYQSGGALETVIDGKTGIFFPKQTVSSLTKAISKLETGNLKLSATECRRQAQKFDQTSFLKHFSDKVEELI